VEYAQVCLIDSIAPDTINQFWRITQANNPGQHTVDMKWDMSTGYTVSGTVLPCCSCLTEATALRGAGSFNDYATSNPPPINTLLLLSGVVLIALIIPARKVLPVVVVMLFPFTLPAQGQPGGTTYDIEYSCVCLVDSIATDTINQFWRFTQSNNPGQRTVDVNYDFSTSYTVSGTVLSCKDYYLGDNPGGSGTANTLAMWTGPNALGNSSVTESGTIISSSLTGAFKLPEGTDAQDPVWAAGMLRYNTSVAKYQVYSGAEMYLPYWNGTATSTLLAYWDGTKLVSDANLAWSGARLRVGSGAADNGISLDGNTTVNIGLFKGSGSGSGGPEHIKISNHSNSGSEGHTAYYGGGALRVRVGKYQNKFGVMTDTLYSLAVGRNLFVRTQNITGGTAPGSLYLWPGSGINDNNAGELFIRSGHMEAETNGITTGKTGNIYIQTYYDHNTQDSATTIRTHMMFSGQNARTTTQMYHRLQTTSGIQTLTMESDTIKYRIENIGTISTSTDGSGDIVVAHGMGTTPTSVQVTVTGTTPYVVTVHTIDATNFTVRFFDMAGAAVTSTAVTATWHAKT